MPEFVSFKPIPLALDPEVKIKGIIPGISCRHCWTSGYFLELMVTLLSSHVSFIEYHRKKGSLFATFRAIYLFGNSSSALSKLP